MSRIGRLPIEIPQGVQVRMDGDIFVAKGPKGEHSERIHGDMTVEIEEKEVRVVRPTEQKRHRSLHGLSRSLIANTVHGVSSGFEKKLEIRGVGYRAEVKGNKLVLNVGIKAESPTLVAVSGVSKQQVGQVAAEIRGVRPPEPYKGKGIRHEGEYVRHKAGKTAGK
jgi:large subunit ribosomal protein L6